MDKDILIRSMYEGYIFLHLKKNENKIEKKGIQPIYSSILRDRKRFLKKLYSDSKMSLHQIKTLSLLRPSPLPCTFHE